MKNYRIEVGENAKASVCHCCDKQSHNGHCFVYKNGDAYAIYYAGWSHTHRTNKVTLALAVGEFSDSSKERTCFGLEVSILDSKIQLEFIQPKNSPWGNTALLGQMLEKEQAQRHQLSKEAKAIALEIASYHSAIQQYLEQENTKFQKTANAHLN